MNGPLFIGIVVMIAAMLSIAIRAARTLDRNKRARPRGPVGRDAGAATDDRAGEGD